VKIAISMTGNAPDALVDPRFGRCGWFALCDSQTDALSFEENAAASAGGGAGLAAAQQIIDNDVEAVVTGAAGPNAFNVLHNAGIRIYRCGSVTMRTALQLLKEAKLEEIISAGPSHAGMGGGR
jgi:predicted Fe-Mo cluster-binding NifX family protein